MADVGRKAKKSRMKPADFAKLRKELGLSQTTLGKWLDLSTNSISMMELGEIPISKPIALIFKLVKEGRIRVGE